MLSIKYQREQIQSNYQKLINLITNHYSDNNFTYLQTTLSLEELQELHIGTTIEDYQEAFVNRSGIYGKLLSPTNSEELSTSLKSLLVGALKAVNASGFRADKLLKSLEANMTCSSGKLNYAAVNAFIRGLDTDIRIQNQLLQIVNTLMPKSQTTVNVLNVQATQAQEAERLTRDEALELIQNNAQELLTSPENLEAIYLEHAIEVTPSVSAIAGQEKGPLAIGPGNSMVPDELILDLDD